MKQSQYNLGPAFLDQNRVLELSAMANRILSGTATLADQTAMKEMARPELSAVQSMLQSQQM